MSTTRSGTLPPEERTPVSGLVDHLFRHSAGRMVSSLTRMLGPDNLQLAEEAVQDALLKALQTWPFSGVPDNPGGWLLQVARNRALDRLRRESTLQGKLVEIEAAGFMRRSGDGAEELTSGDEFRDDELRMMLMCCHPALPPEVRIALTLSTVGGFSVPEIARAFLSKPATIAQRLVRAKRLIRQRRVSFELPAPAALSARLDSVLTVLYLLFNEGYGAHQGDDLVRSDLCAEAIRLASILAEHPATGSPKTHALLALMLLQGARLPARTDAEGRPHLLAEQDRSLWDRPMIDRGLRHLDRCSAGSELTSYHLQAGIAACHAVAPNVEATDWEAILTLYDQLIELDSSPVIALNRAVAVARVHGPNAGIRVIEEIGGHAALHQYYLLPATLADLWMEAGRPERAAEYYRRALVLPCTIPEQHFMARKLEECEIDSSAPPS